MSGCTCVSPGISFDCEYCHTPDPELICLRAANADLQKRLSATVEQWSHAVKMHEHAAKDVSFLTAERDEWKQRRDFQVGLVSQRDSQLAARDAELAEMRRELLRSYVPQAVAIECNDALVGAGMGKPGKPNTLINMVHEIIAQLAAEKAARERAEALIFDEREAAEAERRNWNRLVEYTRSHRDRLWWQSFAGAWEGIGRYMFCMAGLTGQIARSQRGAERARAQEQRADYAEAGAAEYRATLQLIAEKCCMQSSEEPEFFCKHDGSGHSCYCPVTIAGNALATDAGSALLAELAGLRERCAVLQSALEHVHAYFPTEQAKTALAGNAKRVVCVKCKTPTEHPAHCPDCGNYCGRCADEWQCPKCGRCCREGALAGNANANEVK